MEDALTGRNVLSRKYRLSINPRLINKNEGNETELYRKGWENRSLTPRQLAEQINKGVAYCCELSGARNAKNFVCSELLSVDIDGTRTITEAMDDPIVKAHLTIFYTTPSHTETRHRFRLIFALPRPIETAKEMVAAFRSLALRLGGDTSATDASRIFFGSRQSNPKIFDRELSLELLDELIRQGLDSNQTEQSSRGPVASIARQALDPDKAIKLANGEFLAFRDLEWNTSVHCPFHFDENSSAFVVRSNAGILGIHCSTCTQTFWPPGTTHGYEFDDFDRRLHEAEVYFNENKDIGPFQAFLPGPYHAGLNTSHIYRQSNQFLELPEKLPDGLVFIKSPKGSGKTERLQQILRSEKRSAILIGHRVALIEQSCKRLGLECYLDVKGPIAIKNLGICLDSLHRLTWRQTEVNLFQTVIIDESEQVLSHFLSDTIDYGSRDKLFKLFAMLLRESKRVIALDADLGWLTFETISKLSQPAGSGKPERPSTVFVNEWPKSSSIQIFASKDHLVGDMMQAICDGLRVFVVSNSLRLVTSLSEAIKAELENAETILITSDTVGTDDVKAFIKNSAKRALEYRAILTSPSLGTGVDITFEGSKQLIDVVYGFFEAGITTHFDCDQQLGRVRHPGAIRTWVSPQRSSFDTARDVVKREIQQKGMYKSVFSDFDDDRVPKYHTDDPLIDMAALARSQQLASKNNLKKNFVALKRRQGFEVEFVVSEKEVSREGAAIRQKGSALADKKLSSALLSAKTLSNEEFDEISDLIAENAVVGQKDRFNLLRTQLELFYREPISLEQITRDNRGQFRKQVKRYEDLSRYVDTLKQTHPSPFRESMQVKSTAFLKKQELRRRFLRDEREVPRIMHQLLTATPIYKMGVFKLDLEFSLLDLRGFMHEILKQKPVVENALEFGVRASEDDGVPQLTQLLAIIGLFSEKTGKTKAKTIAGGRTIYRYRLSHEAYQLMQATVNRRSAIGGWKFVNSLYGFPE